MNTNLPIGSGSRLEQPSTVIADSEASPASGPTSNARHTPAADGSDVVQHDRATARLLVERLFGNDGAKLAAHIEATRDDRPSGVAGWLWRAKRLAGYAEPVTAQLGATPAQTAKTDDGTVTHQHYLVLVGNAPKILSDVKTIQKNRSSTTTTIRNSVDLGLEPTAANLLTLGFDVAAINGVLDDKLHFIAAAGV